MELSLNTKCEELRHENRKIEQENEDLIAWIESQEKKGRVQGELQRFSEIKQHEDGRPVNTRYGENPQALKKWDLSWSERVIPQIEDIQLNETSNHENTNEICPIENGHPDLDLQREGNFPPLHSQQHIYGISAREFALSDPYSKDTPQGIQEIICERDAYKQKVAKLEGDINKICRERAVLEQKYQVKLEVCERLQEDNQRLSSIIPHYQQRATLATDDDIEVLKEACRVYQEDFQAERLQREEVQAEKERLKTELAQSKQEIKTLNEKVTFLMSILRHQQPPSPLRRTPYQGWEFNETCRAISPTGHLPQRRNTYTTSPTRQPGDVIRRGLYCNNKAADFRPDLYAVVDDLDVKDGATPVRYYRGRRKSMSL